MVKKTLNFFLLLSEIMTSRTAQHIFSPPCLWKRALRDYHSLQKRGGEGTGQKTLKLTLKCLLLVHEAILNFHFEIFIFKKISVWGDDLSEMLRISPEEIYEGWKKKMEKCDEEILTLDPDLTQTGINIEFPMHFCFAAVSSFCIFATFRYQILSRDKRRKRGPDCRAKSDPGGEKRRRRGENTRRRNSPGGKYVAPSRVSTMTNKNILQ